MIHYNNLAKTSSRTADKFVVRLPDGMRERIQGVAKGNHRSMNSEIIARLEVSLDDTGMNSADEVDAASITHAEARLLANFRAMSTRQQRAMIEIITRDEVTEPLVEAKCA